MFLVFFLISDNTLLLCATFFRLDLILFPDVTVCAPNMHWSLSDFFFDHSLSSHTSSGEIPSGILLWLYSVYKHSSTLILSNPTCTVASPLKDFIAYFSYSGYGYLWSCLLCFLLLPKIYHQYEGDAPKHILIYLRRISNVSKLKEWNSWFGAQFCSFFY